MHKRYCFFYLNRIVLHISRFTFQNYTELEMTLDEVQCRYDSSVRQIAAAEQEVVKLQKLLDDERNQVWQQTQVAQTAKSRAYLMHGPNDYLQCIPHLQANVIKRKRNWMSFKNVSANYRKTTGLYPRGSYTWKR